MKVVYFAHSVLNRGGDKMVLAHLAHLAESGHEVTVVTNDFRTVFPVHPLIAVKKISFPGKMGSILAALFMRHSADAVIASIVAMAVLLSFRNRGKVSLFAQDYNENIYRSKALRVLVRCLYTVHFSLFKNPTAAVSEQLAALFASTYGAAVALVPNGVDLKKFYIDPDNELLRKKGETKAILIFSRRDFRKGFDLSIEIIKRLASQKALPFQVWNVGDMLDEGELPVGGCGFGYVDEEHMRGIMSSADLFLYPSRSEGFPLMVMEAFACGCPVVTTDAVPYARDGENAFVASVGDVDGLAEKVAMALRGEGVECVVDGGFSCARRFSLDSSSSRFESFLLERPTPLT
ncbi:MAG: glycosyltransferase [Deltaproteobacteria bacterium]|nr:glycosyltransferase [Deltaproteobacteria bacterium]